MKKLIFIIIFLLSISTSYSQFEIKLNEELFVSQISENVFVVTHYFPWESNSLVIKASPMDVVLIDTPYDTLATSLMLNWVKCNLKPQKISAINTGYHIDNLGGNVRLAQDGINIYGSDLTVKLLVERSAKTQKQIISWLTSGQEKYKQAYEKMTFCKPNRVFPIEKGLSKKIGDLSFEVYFPGESHSPDNVVVYIKEKKLLFGGCMIKSLSSKNLGFTGDANLTEWPNSVGKIQSRYKDANIVVPHHGMWGDNRLIQHTLELLKK